MITRPGERKTLVSVRLHGARRFLLVSASFRRRTPSSSPILGQLPLWAAARLASGTLVLGAATLQQRVVEGDGTERRAAPRRERKTKGTFSTCSYSRRSRPHNCDRTATRGPRGGRYFIYRPPRDGTSASCSGRPAPWTAATPSWPPPLALLGSRRCKDVFRSVREDVASTPGGEDEPGRRGRPAGTRAVRTWRSPWILDAWDTRRSLARARASSSTLYSFRFGI